MHSDDALLAAADAPLLARQAERIQALEAEIEGLNLAADQYSESRDAWMLRAKAAEKELERANVTLDYFEKSSRMWRKAALQQHKTLKEIQAVVLESNQQWPAHFQSFLRFLRVLAAAWRTERRRANEAEALVRELKELVDAAGL